MKRNKKPSYHARKASAVIIAGKDKVVIIIARNVTVNVRRATDLHTPEIAHRGKVKAVMAIVPKATDRRTAVIVHRGKVRVVSEIVRKATDPHTAAIAHKGKVALETVHRAVGKAALVIARKVVPVDKAALVTARKAVPEDKVALVTAHKAVPEGNAPVEVSPRVPVVVADVQAVHPVLVRRQVAPKLKKPSRPRMISVNNGIVYNKQIR